MTPPALPLWTQWTLFVVQVCTLIALVVYVWKTWEMAAATRGAAVAGQNTVLEMQAARREASAPRIAIYFAPEEIRFAEIVVENFGDSAARDVTFTFTPPLASAQRTELATRFFTTPKTLPPHGRMRHALDSWPAYFKSNLPRKYDVKVRYRRLESDEWFEESHILDPGSFEHYLQFDRKDFEDLATRFDKFATHLQRWLERRGNEWHDDRDVDTFAPASGRFDECLGRLQAVATLWKATSTSDDHRDLRFGLPRRILPYALAAHGAARAEGMATDTQQALLDLVLVLTSDRWRYAAVGEDLERGLSAAIDGVLAISYSG